MGILANTTSICHFRAVGDIPSGDPFPFISEQLQQQAFRSIDATLEEQSIGWVQLTDLRDTDFTTPASFWHDGYVAVSLRVDQRKIPSSLSKMYVKAAEEEFLAGHPNLRRVPKQKREDIKDAVRLALLSKTLPVPSLCDVLWDTRSGIVTIASLSAKTIELVEAHFKRTFPDLRLVAIHPMDRAAAVIPEELGDALARANLAGSEAVLDQIRANQWLGQDLLLWLLYRTMNASGEYATGRPGPLDRGTPFVAYVNDRLILMQANESGVQKITVAGAQDHFGEVLTALRGGKRITEAAVTIEQAENQWRLTLKGEVFHFASLKSPPVHLEKDDTVDALAEKEAVFFERMHLLESCLQMFDSLLAQFLVERLGPDWPAWTAAAEKWLSTSDRSSA